MYNSNVMFTYQAGFNMLTVLAAEEFKADKILCMALHPGWVKTELGGDEVNVDFLSNALLHHVFSISTIFKTYFFHCQTLLL